MSTARNERIQQACEAINNAVADEAGKLQAEGLSADEAIATVLASLTAVSAHALTVMIENKHGGLPDFLSGLQRFAQQMANHGMAAYQPGKRPLQ